VPLLAPAALNALLFILRKSLQSWIEASLHTSKKAWFSIFSISIFALAFFKTTCGSDGAKHRFPQLCHAAPPLSSNATAGEHGHGGGHHRRLGGHGGGGEAKPLPEALKKAFLDATKVTDGRPSRKSYTYFSSPQHPALLTPVLIEARGAVHAGRNGREQPPLRR